MIDNREYTALEYQTSESLQNLTTEMTTSTTSSTTWINTTISNGLEDGVIAGIVIGTIMGVIGLFFLAFIIYKYRQRFIDILHQNSKQSDNRSLPNKVDHPLPNITYSPENEYLTVTISSLPRNQ